MKILATTIFSFIFLFQSSGAVLDWGCNVLKIPHLIEHYEEQTADTGISFLDFIDYHYGDQESSQNHEKDKHDGELPFQGNHSHSCCNTVVYLETVDFETDSLKIFQGQTVSLFYQPPFSSASLGSIFQPPKV